MIAIWPAGPPKLIKPSLSQKRKASPKETRAGSAVSSASAYTSSACRIVGVEIIEQLYCFGEELIIIGQRVACTTQQRLYPGRFRHRHPPHVEVVNESPNPLQGRVAVQPKAR